MGEGGGGLKFTSGSSRARRRPNANSGPFANPTTKRGFTMPGHFAPEQGFHAE